MSCSRAATLTAIAQRGEHEVVAIADVADDHLAAMDPDAEADRLAQIWLRNWFSSSTLAAISAAARNAWRQASRRLTVSPNSASMPSPTNWFGGRRLRYGLRHRADEAIDDEDRIERQSLFGKLRRAAHVDEHADEIALLADRAGLRRLRASPPWSAAGTAERTTNPLSGAAGTRDESGVRGADPLAARRPRAARGRRKRGVADTRIRQVEQRALPPHTQACGTLLRKLASSTLRPFGTRTVRPLGRTADHAAAAFAQRARAARQEDAAERPP